MPAVDLGVRLKTLRQSRKPVMSRKALGESVGYQGESAYQAVYEWETGRRQLPASEVPRLAEVLGVTICELYGVDEGHTRQHDREKRVREVRDAAVARLMAGHEQAPKAEQDFIREIAEAAERFRQRLVSEEGLDGPVPATPAALTD